MLLIDKKSPIPYYDQLAELLRHEIGATAGAGETYQLPSENELAEQHGISRPDGAPRAGRAGAGRLDLSPEGRRLLCRRAARRAGADGAGFDHRGDAAARLARSRHASSASTRCLPPPTWRGAGAAGGRAGLRGAAGCALADGAPAQHSDQLPARRRSAPGWKRTTCPSRSTGCSRAVTACGCGPAQETLRARGATSHEAHLLDIQEGTPVMYTERITYAANGMPVEYLDAVWRGDRYDFKVTLTPTVDLDAE